MMRRRGLFACSEVGFNLALDPLARTQKAVKDWLEEGAPSAQHYAVPPLLRSDWVAGEWHNPPRELWCKETPGEHLLTPRPLMHLLNRMRWHPVEAGQWVLSGWCFRDEDPSRTLPLLRQRAFFLAEHAQIGTKMDCTAWARHEMARWWKQGVALDLPLVHQSNDVSERCDEWIDLLLPGTEPVRLAHAEVLPIQVSGAYLKESVACATVGLGLERWLLALAARHGVEPDDWPKLPEQQGPACLLKR